MNGRCRIPLVVAGMLSAAFHAGVAPVAAGASRSPPDFAGGSDGRAQ